jgi:aspartyl aminopeptidase
MQEFLQFLNRSPTSWHAARAISEKLAEAGFIPITEDEHWKLERDQSYFCLRDDAALCAFRLPSEPFRSAVLLASHLDSCALKLKPNPDLSQDQLSQFSTEVYGSPLLHTWLDRDLALAGRVIVQRGGELQHHLVFLDDYPMIIPSLPLHLDRSVTDRGVMINKQDHLKPIVALSKKGPVTLEALLRKHLAFDQLIAFDLFLVSLEKAASLGFAGELIASSRLDNLASAYACTHAIIEAEKKDFLQLAVFWDHEEVGSKTFSGAESFFVNEVLERICFFEKMNPEEYYRMKSRSTSVSVDMAHGYHPNFSDRFDPTNTPVLGGGVVLKTSAMQRYATNATTALPLIRLAEKKGWPLQMYASRSDISPGSTVGSIMSAVAGIPTVDIGIASWAMHSIRETMARDDEISLCHFLKAVLEEAPLYASKN